MKEDDDDEFGGGEFAEDDLEEADQRGCIDPWRGQVDASIPDEYLR